MNPFLLRPRERQADWKAFRKSLSLMSEQQQLAEVARYWAQTPTLKKAHDPYRPQDWSGPWEMVSDNRWCRLSTAIGMDFTLRLAGWAPERLCLKLIADHEWSGTFFVVEVDGQNWLNHEYRKVIAPTHHYEELCGWSYDGRQYQAVSLRTCELAA